MKFQKDDIIEFKSIFLKTASIYYKVLKINSDASYTLVATSYTGKNIFERPFSITRKYVEEKFQKIENNLKIHSHPLTTIFK